jgi:hypothetical protein
MGLLRKAANQNHLIFPSQFPASQQSILSRPAHVQAGDDVEDFRHFIARIFSTQLKNRLDFFPVRKENKYYLWDWGLIED